MTVSNVRIGGSGYTVFAFKGQTMAYVRNISDNPPRPVGNVEPIQPIDHATPIEIVYPQAVGAGTLTVEFYDIWNTSVWSRLPGLENTNNLLDVFKRQLSLGEITCQKIIKTPNGALRSRVYHNCVITDINEGETIAIDTMSIPKRVTIMYTHTSVV